ncbi:MAG: DUF58 domain-containing protein [Actinomycetota bacterium]|nr:DUF58 domain-containing protein [Actinomycetota bacterium]
MPTARGWVVGLSGCALMILGTALGVRSVQQLGIGLVILVVAAVVVVRLGKHDVGVVRSVQPERTVSGQRVTVSLVLTNNGRGAAPLMLLEDRLPRQVSGRARFALHGIEAAGSRELSFGLRPPRRGLFQVGPLEMAFVDPFGLAQIRSHSGEKTSFLAYPAVEPLNLPRDLGRQQSMVVSALRRPTGAQGDEFYTLREFVQGDDLRKIHWASTAKRRTYMIRQEETPWHTRATILLDDCMLRHEGSGGSASFERAVEAAASVVDLYHRSGYSSRLVTANGGTIDGARGADHVHRCLDLLATIQATRPEPGAADPLIARFAELQSGPTAEGTLVFVGGSLFSGSVTGLAQCRRRYREVFCVSFPAHRFGSDTTRSRWDGEGETVDMMRLLTRSGIRTIVLGPEEPLAPAWASLSAAGRRGGERTWERRPEPV